MYINGNLKVLIYIQARNLTFYGTLDSKKCELKFINVVINLRRLSLVFMMLRLSALFVINEKQGS